MPTPRIWVLKLFKAYGGRTNDKQWSNAYHIASDADIIDVDWSPLVTAMADREASFHLPQVNYMRATLSTWDRETVYDPMTLRVFELAALGQRSLPSGEQPMSLDLAMKCKKNVAYGRSGTMFYRGVLHSGDVTVGAGGDATLTSPGDTSMQQLVAGTITAWATPLGAVNGTIVMPPRQVLTGPPVLSEARNVASLSVSGVSVNKRNHRYFDKAASDDGVGVGT